MDIRYSIEILNFDRNASKNIGILAKNDTEMMQQLNIYLQKIGWDKDHIQTIIKT